MRPGRRGRGSNRYARSRSTFQRSSQSTFIEPGDASGGSSTRSPCGGLHAGMTGDRSEFIACYTGIETGQSVVRAHDVGDPAQGLDRRVHRPTRSLHAAAPLRAVNALRRSDRLVVHRPSRARVGRRRRVSPACASSARTRARSTPSWRASGSSAGRLAGARTSTRSRRRSTSSRASSCSTSVGASTGSSRATSRSSRPASGTRLGNTGRRAGPVLSLNSPQRLDPARGRDATRSSSRPRTWPRMDAAAVRPAVRRPDPSLVGHYDGTPPQAEALAVRDPARGRAPAGRTRRSWPTAGSR